MVANFDFAAADHLLGELTTLIVMSSHNMEHSAKYGEEQVRQTEKNQKALAESVACIEFVEKATDALLGWLKCPHIEEANRNLRRWTRSDPKKWSELNTRARALRNAIKTELKCYLLYIYPKERGDKFRTWKKDWEVSVNAFPDIEWDVYEATDCYALQHHTASVFHSMRVAEHGLRALAKERRINLPKNKPIEWATWQEIIKALDDEIKVIGTTWKAGKAKDSALAFYSGTRAELNGFKDEYRNLVMHVRAHYDEFQAARALSRVHAFMEAISEKIDHKHHRIRWGRPS
ncbi:MAG TPA: hypothetical protein VFW19_08910 [Allosphingosinicella sp.]|nr:hypothetical protein [Allosphingosinicella sp.]